ncbi:MAG: valine--tRNA ligase [Patescibacteria group bacterium]
MNLDERLLKPYNPATTEDRIYREWLAKRAFEPQGEGEAFSMVMPPPNVTGVLHLGHAAMIAIEDIMVRYARMQGKRTLWLPGTDHAAIATQTKVEEMIYKAEGKTRHDLGREEFLKRVTAFATESHDKIVEQIKKLGASTDWTREAYTLDERRARAVREAFVRMYEAGLIYRGERIVNWDPRLQTTVSDDELEMKEVTEPFYYLKYGPFIIGTARPETKFGDKYVVMHPADKRYANYEHGQKLEVTWLNGQITATVIKDESIDMTFGTGVMTITPAHDTTDAAIAARHGLESEQIIDLKGKLLPIAGEFAGLHIKKARGAIVEKLKTLGLVEKIEEKYVHNVPVNSRGGETIEPQILRQWFVDVNKPIAERNGASLKALMREAVASGGIKIIPEQFEKIYFHWIDNLRDWCISRQIWYGHQIPVWYRGEEIYVGVEPPSAAWQSEGWVADPDTLDTWFSSGLWTFSTLGWPEATADLKAFHPTTVLETGYDILFFWVARMILMSRLLLNQLPFKTVYLHGLVRDEKGQKMSKSKGNSVDPLAMIAKYGADALRLSLIIGTSPGSDVRISEDKIRGYKNFSNKLWNIARFILTAIEGEVPARPESLSASTTSRLAELEAVTKDITDDIEHYRFYLAGEKLYHYVWHTLADKIIEAAKAPLQVPSEAPEIRFLLYTIFDRMLRLLHPFTPFITEELWSLWPKTERELLINTPWPKI